MEAAKVEEHVRNKISRFFDKYPVTRFQAGETLIQAGINPTSIFFIVSGQVKQCDISKRGSELVLNVYRSPSFFPITWALNGSQNIYSYQAVDYTVTKRAPIQDVLDWLQEEPDVTFDLLVRLQSGLEGMMKRMTYAMSGTAQEKIVSELLINGERFGIPNEGGFSLKLSVNELSARCGIARETASRELAHLKDKGIISQTVGKIVVTNKEALRDLLR